jgi:hypothetical protein
MEGLMLRAGGLLPDVATPWPVAQWIDRQFPRPPGPALLLDPYSGAVDCFARADICNWRAQSADWRREGRAFAPPKDRWRTETAALELACSSGVRSVDLQYVVLWTQQHPPEEALSDGLRQWREQGFQVVRSEPVEAPRRGRLETALRWLYHPAIADKARRSLGQEGRFALRLLRRQTTDSEDGAS